MRTQCIQKWGKEAKNGPIFWGKEATLIAPLQMTVVLGVKKCGAVFNREGVCYSKGLGHFPIQITAFHPLTSPNCLTSPSMVLSVSKASQTLGREIGHQPTGSFLFCDVCISHCNSVLQNVQFCIEILYFITAIGFGAEALTRVRHHQDPCLPQDYPLLWFCFCVTALNQKPRMAQCIWGRHEWAMEREMDDGWEEGWFPERTSLSRKGSSGVCEEAVPAPDEPEANAAEFRGSPWKADGVILEGVEAKKPSGHFSTLINNLDGCKTLSGRHKEGLGVQRHVLRGLPSRILQGVEGIYTVTR